MGKQVRVAVLGAAGVGKSSLVKQFVTGQFNEHCQSTTRRRLHHPAVIINENVFELLLVDLPPIQSIPQDTLQEWKLFKGLGPGAATAYLLLFDASKPQSFQLVEHLYEQILRAHGDGIVVTVVANKIDLLISASPAKSDSNTKPSLIYKSSLGNINELKQISALVRKQWRVPYIECSAKHNLHVTSVFQQLVSQMGNLNDSASQTRIRAKSSERALHRLHSLSSPRRIRIRSQSEERCSIQ